MRCAPHTSSLGVRPSFTVLLTKIKILPSRQSLRWFGERQIAGILLWNEVNTKGRGYIAAKKLVESFPLGCRVPSSATDKS